MKTIIEPFRIKSVEPIYFTTKEQRKEILQKADYNSFRIHANNVLIDLLTDSGTSAMSSNQWAGIMQGDESYAGSSSFFKFEESVRSITGMPYIIPTHQGRAAEKIIFTILGGNGKYFISNTLFDTTRANIEFSGAEGIDCLCAEGKKPTVPAPFKGNMDTGLLRKTIEARGAANIPMVIITITNNSGGGQPVSMQNIKDTRAICDEYNIPLFIDACRFAENAWFIKQREEGQRDRTVVEIVNDIFACADGMTMSAKKDAFANIGGWLALNDDALAEEARTRLILTEGFPTYGGLAGRDLDAIAQGLSEIVDEDYLRYRVRVNEYVLERLIAEGVPVVRPAGGHAVFLDAGVMLPHVPPLHYPGQALAVALYEEGGVRGCEIGTVMFGRQPDGSERPARRELVRLAMPRRVYTQSHADYVVETILAVHQRRSELRGLRIVRQPRALRHFTAAFSPLLS